MTDKYNLPIARIRSEVSIMLRDKFPATFVTFNGLTDGKEHFAIRLGEQSEKRALVRIHSECVTGDVFGSLRCDCGEQLNEALQRISDEGGCLLYMRQEGRGIGLLSKLDAYLLQDKGMDTFEANLALAYPEDAREYVCAAQMIEALGLRSIRLLTNNTQKVNALTSCGIRVVEQVATGVHASRFNIAYLQAKVKKHGHTINLTQLEELAE